MPHNNSNALTQEQYEQVRKFISSITGITSISKTFLPASSISSINSTCSTSVTDATTNNSSQELTSQPTPPEPSDSLTATVTAKMIQEKNFNRQGDNIPPASIDIQVSARVATVANATVGTTLATTASITTSGTTSDTVATESETVSEDCTDSGNLVFTSRKSVLGQNTILANHNDERSCLQLGLQTFDATSYHDYLTSLRQVIKNGDAVHFQYHYCYQPRITVTYQSSAYEKFNSRVFCLENQRPINSKYDSSMLNLIMLYRDEHICVVDKPFGLLSVPGFVDDSAETRVNDSSGYAQAAHRLDMATSGLMVIALSKEADASLKQQFRDRKVFKSYIALVRGKVTSEQGFIALPLATNWVLKPRQRVDFDNGKEALTEYQVVAYYPEMDFTIVRLFPHTGRTHQLRVHMAAIGHAICGDKFYDSNYRDGSFQRLCLHSNYLGFNHPITGQAMSFESLCNFFDHGNAPDYIERNIIFEVPELTDLVGISKQDNLTSNYSKQQRETAEAFVRQHLSASFQ